MQADTDKVEKIVLVDSLTPSQNEDTTYDELLPIEEFNHTH